MLYLQQLNLTHFRNFSELELNPHPHFNILYGENGSGKTSLLESIYMLSTGRSFRTHLAHRAIQHGHDKTTLFAKLHMHPNHQPLKVGLERNKVKGLTVKVGGEICRSVAEMAKLLPIILINPDSYFLLEAGPKYRRQFVDWGLFHVEPSFMEIWSNYQRLLKQRNAALSSRANRSQLRIWSRELAKYGEILNQMRKNYCIKIEDQLKPQLHALNLDLDIHLNYHQGWKLGEKLESYLEQHLERDFELGHTHAGPHRFDLTFRSQKTPIDDVFSRGQLKILVIALYLTQAALLKAEDKKCIYLIDDLLSELDHARQNYLFTTLRSLDSQVFVTGLDRTRLEELWKQGSAKMFHVEQNILHLRNE